MTYKNKGWISWGDWLGTDFVATFNRNYKSYKEAKKYLKSLKIKSGTEWRKYTKHQLSQMTYLGNPETVYKNKGWISWGEFSTGNVANKDKHFMSLKMLKYLLKN